MRKRANRKPLVIYRYTHWDEMMASATEPVPEAHRIHQLTQMWEGLHAMEQAPAPEPNDWRLVSDAVNLLETLVEMGVCEDASGLLQDAIAALAKAGERHKAGGSIRLDAEGIKAVRAVLEDYAAMLETLPARTIIRAHRLTERRIHAIVQGKTKKNDVRIIVSV